MIDTNSCPKCGSKMCCGPYQIGFFPDSEGWEIYCDECHHVEHAFSEKDVIKEWNKTHIKEQSRRYMKLGEI